MKTTKNVFNKGVVASPDIINHPSDSLFSAKNADFLNTEGALFAITNQRGNTLKGQLSNAVIPVVAKSVKGVAFIFSIQVTTANIPTGIAEIGCFPSPVWTLSGKQALQQVYKPLMNYAGDTNLFPQSNGPFSSNQFNIQEGSDFEMEIQNDYDGSVNLIINDGKNPPWIINSGFAIHFGQYSEIINRKGKNTNRYTLNNFKNTLKLILNSSKIMGVSFDGLREGGKLKAGHYRYYFYYMTNDGTYTQMVNESMDVHVFNGNTPGDIHGDNATGQTTNKFVQFNLTNLDDSFPFIKVFYTFSFGSSEAILSPIELVNPVSFKGSSTVFTHTGYEQNNGISPDFLNKRIGSIESIGSIAQIQGHLFGANVREKGRSFDLFRKFSGETRLGSKSISMDVFGVKNGFTDVNNGKTNNATSGDAYVGGYFNPYNIYNHIGYFGNESYPFGIVFIFKDGSVTPAFPVMGVDNGKGNKDILLDNITAAQITQMQEAGGYLSGDTNLINSNGVYRFPERVTNPGILLDPNDSSKAKVNGVTFKLPDINNPQYAEIMEETIGCFFVRGERKPDLITQGYMIDTITIPSIDVGSPNQPYESLARYRAGYSDITSKFVPAFDFLLESVKSYETYGSERERSNFKGKGGIHPFKFNFKGKDFAFREKFAFVSADVALDKDRILQALSSKDVRLDVLAKVNTLYDVPTKSAIDPTLNDHFSVIRTTGFSYTNSTLQAKANWVIGGSGLKSNEGFSGAAFINCRQRTSGDIFYYHFPIHFNDYIGLNIPQKYTLGSPAPFGNEDGERQRALFGESKQAAALVNIYESGGPKSVDNLKSIYNTTIGETYHQISKRFYWNANVEDADPALTLDSAKDVNGKITCYGGDCFINPIYRKIFFNQYKDQTSDIDDTNENSKTNVGYTLMLLTESNLNVALRSEEVADVSEPGKRTFSPYGITGNEIGDIFGEGNRLRKSRLLESSLLNKGYKYVQSQRNYFSLAENLSFMGSEWFSRVIASPKHTPNSFDNAYRNLSGVNFQDYNPELGRIVRIMNFRNNLLAIYENGVLMVPVNQRIQTGGDVGGSVFLESQGVLPPAANPVSSDIGSKWHDSIIYCNGIALGVDSDKDLIWKYDGESFGETSLMRYDPILREYLKSYKGSEKKLFKNISAHFNMGTKSVLWSFIGKQFGAETIGYNFLLEGFTGSTDYIPLVSFELPGRFFTFNSKIAFRDFYLHDDVTQVYGKFYGVQHPFKISFTVNTDSDFDKVFDNLTIISNNILPKKITYTTQGTKTVQSIVFNPIMKRLSNATYRHGQVDVSIPPVDQVTNDLEYGFIDSARANALSIIKKKSRQKGHAILIEVEYDSMSLVKINAILTHFRLSQ